MKKIIALLSSVLLASTAFAQQLIYEDETTAARKRIPLYLVDDTDGKTPETGVTFSAGDIKCSENGAAEANHAGTVTELAGGAYYYEAANAEVDTPGFLMCRFTKSGVRTFVAHANILPHQLNEAAPSSPTTGSAWARLKTLTDPEGTAQGGNVAYIDLATAASSTDDFYNNNTTVAVVGGTGQGQNRCITDYVGSSRRATPLTNFTTAPDNTSQYVLIATPNCNPGSVPVTVATGGITSSSFAAGAIDASAIAANAIAASEIADGAIDAGAIAGDAITSAKIANDAIGSTEVADGALTAAKLASGAITTSTFAAGAINAAALGTDVKGATYNSSTDTLENIRDNLGVNVTLANDAITAAKIASDGGNEIADRVWRRNSANIESSSDGDTLSFQSPYGMVAQQTNNTSVSGTTLTIKKADGTTTFATRTLTTSAGASPITGLSN